jgi:glyoxylase-like metal-dependent hydrolase (beta-lactamase superfamily II)
MAGLTLPTRIMQRQAQWTLSDYRITSARTNVDIGDLAATDSVRAIAAASPPPPRFTVAVDSVAPGVWILDSGLYHTIAVEQSDKIILIEAPDGDARTLAAIAKARERWPDKQLGPVVNSHHHFDHAGGVRAAISQGLSIITHIGNEAFLEQFVYPRRHTINPDALERNPKPLSLTSVRGKLVLEDSVRPVELYEATGVAHSGSALLVYVPVARVLIQGDLEMSELVENVRRLRLDVDVLLGLHDRPARWQKNQS